eukprot:g5310.t1
MGLSSFFGAFFFTWLNPIVAKGYRSKDGIGMDDLPPVAERDQVQPMLTGVLSVADRHRGSSLAGVLARFVRFELLCSAVLHSIYVACQLGSPLILRELVVAVDNGDDSGWWIALMLALVQITGAAANQHHLQMTFHIGCRLRALVSSLVYRSSINKRLSELGRSCGTGGSGQLGHGNTEIQFVPKLIEALSGVRVSAVSAGYEHSLFLTEDGKVYSCGHGGFGKLGHGNRECQLVPKLIEALSGVRVCGVSTGEDHNLFVTEDGKVYSCGRGCYGTLGHGNTVDQHVPKRIETLA